MKKTVMYLVLVAVVVLICEAVGYVGLAILYKSPSPGPLVISLHDRIIKEAAESKMDKQDVVLHPFIGYVSNPNSPDQSHKRHYEYMSSALQGFYSDKSLVPFNRNDVVSIAILGGSVAHYFFNAKHPKLKEFFSSIPEFKGKDIRLFDLSNWGYKQPQQLMALEYLRSLGATFDVVVNIDGFNEVATSFVLNGERSVSVFMPGNWDIMTGEMPSKKAIILFGEKSFVVSLKQRFSLLVAGWPFESNIVRFVWAGVYGIANNAEQHLDEEISKEKGSTKSTDAVIVSPSQKVYWGENYALNEKVQMSRLVSQWATASIQINNTVASDGGRYFHFLQPNQYVENSKSFSEAEHKLYVNPQNPGAPYAKQGYPWLIKTGMFLRDKGVFFDDLTNIYKSTSETVYNDDCCHVNELGNEILLKEIETFILSNWKDHSRIVENSGPALDKALSALFPLSFYFDAINDPDNGHLMLSGFGDIEGKEPSKWIWGYNNESTLKFFSNGEVKSRLDVDIVNLYSDQSIDVSVNGKILVNGYPCLQAEGPFDVSKLTHLSVDFTAKPGCNIVVISPKQWNRETVGETRPFSVKFNHLTVQSVDQ